MCGMPAVKVRSQVTARMPSAKKAQTKAKVIEITLRSRTTPSHEIPEDLRGTYVLRYRMKARKLAKSILRKWHSRLDIQEVESVVDLSLCEAVRRFNPSKGASFMTFLFYHLRGNLIRTVATAANSQLLAILDQESGDSEDSNQWMNRGTIRGVLASEVTDSLVGAEEELPDEALLRKEIAGLSERACQKLDPLEREVIERIFLNEEQLLDVAKSLGYSRCHISRVKRKALETLHGELSGALQMKRQGSFEDEVTPRIKLGQRKAPTRRRRQASKELSRVSAYQIENGVAVAVN